MNKVPEQSIRDLIQSSGLLSSWQDMNGQSQPAPLVQMFEFDETVAENQRIMLIRNASSGTGDYLVLEPSYEIVVFSKSAPGDGGFARFYAELVKGWLLANFTIGCIMAVELTGDVAGPRILASGRRAYVISINVLLDTGET